MKKVTKKVSKDTESIKIVAKEQVEPEDPKSKTSQIKRIVDSDEATSETGVITRFRGDLKKGLTDEQVNQRIAEGLSNNINQGSTKSVPNIIFTNINCFRIFLFIYKNWWINSTLYFYFRY